MSRDGTWIATPSGRVFVGDMSPKSGRTAHNRLGKRLPSSARPKYGGGVKNGHVKYCSRTVNTRNHGQRCMNSQHRDMKKVKNKLNSGDFYYHERGQRGWKHQGSNSDECCIIL
mmetsp:Transcript_18188/g.28784  ORF Transcript_18188/g.28784 Transcript_18188/m.28784 type:complete len:114 (+) Transcript_18188:116-457(+)